MAGIKKENKNRNSLIAENRFKTPPIKSLHRKKKYKEKKIRPFSKFKPKLFTSAFAKNQHLYFKSNLEFLLAGQFYCNPRYVYNGNLLLFRS